MQYKMVGMISKEIMQGMGCKMSTLLQQAQEIFKLNAKWNRAIGLIKEVSIRHYEQDEFREMIDEIVKEVFNGKDINAR